MSNVGGFTLVSLVLWTALAVDARAEVPAFLCGPARVEQDGSAAFGMAVDDRFATRGLTLDRPDSACWATLPGTDQRDASVGGELAHDGRRCDVRGEADRQPDADAEDRPGHVGWITRYTLVGTFADATTLHAAFANWIDGHPYLSGDTVSTSLAVAP